ncbi:phosphohydrolase [Patescibacteria group bacterium]|nr:phosphohydrolase [Patescibacteria group bacterium]
MNRLVKVKKNLQILEFIRQSAKSMSAIGYTEHGLRHAELVSKRAGWLAKQVGLDKNKQELASIVGFCHDAGNFMGRTQHHYWGAVLFHQVFSNNDDCIFSAKEITSIVQAVVNHDKYTMKLTNGISAIVVLADKSDTSRSRVEAKSIKEITKDIHNRVNYAVTDSKLIVDKQKNIISLSLKIDTKFVSIMEYFEIFTDRMSYCRKAAECLGYKFGLIINDFKLS